MKTILILCVMLLMQAMFSADAANSQQKSVRDWVKCNGGDDTDGLAKAISAARHGSFVLVIDCPLQLKIGNDIDKSIFIDDGTTVIFTSAGKITLDNVLHPAFVLADASDITLTDWNVEYDAVTPADWNVGGFSRSGRFTAVPQGHSQPSNAFNDMTLTTWLAANRGITFDRREGNVNSRWSGPTNCSAIFYLAGDTHHVTVTGMRVHVPATAGVERFVATVFSLNPNYKAKQTVTAKGPLNGTTLGIPHDLVFSNIEFDGTYMGWVGTTQNAQFDNIKSHRYGDLQDAAGGSLGGVGKWFAPPHLFYLSYVTDGDPALFNRNIHIEQVVDDGPRVGLARDRGGADSISGYALSLKIGCVDCSVDNYTTNRPDGFIDVLPSNGMTISNVTASYDSAFLNDKFPGWRFPSAGYQNVTFRNIALTDTAAASVQQPISNAPQSSNDGVVFDHVRVIINRWAGPGSLLPNIGGRNQVSLDYTLKADDSRWVMLQKDSAQVSVHAIPSRLAAGGTTQLTWSSKNVSQCAGSGAWTGELGATGSRAVKLDRTGDVDFDMECQSAAGPLGKMTVHIVVGP